MLSYRFMLTPTSALEANYGITYQNKIHYVVSNTNNYMVNTRTQEISVAYVRSFTFRKFNPFVEAGPGVADFPADPQLHDDFVGREAADEVGGLYGAGIAYEISPSFDIRAEYRGIVTKVPTFGFSQLDTKRGTTSTTRPSAWRITSDRFFWTGQEGRGFDPRPSSFCLIRVG